MLTKCAADGTFQPEPKPWGATRRVHRCNDFHVDEIDVQPGGYCSVHKHLAKHNRFTVTSGRLLVLASPHSGHMERADYYDLREGDVCFIPSGRWHVFAALWGPARAVEVYTKAGNPVCLEGDITRACVGGLCADKSVLLVAPDGRPAAFAALAARLVTEAK
jgi:mannose-6-phosphate isomerase-like protein (cupin superfamily)